MFVDTNVLVYAVAPGAPNRDQARAALARHGSTEPLCISPQVLREFVAVITRPQVWSRPKTIREAVEAAVALARSFEVLNEEPRVWEQLVDLCRRFDFGGRQVHDANIVATMLAHGEGRLLTFNGADFLRFPVIEIIGP